MIRLFLLVIACVCCFTMFAQKPVNWEVSVKKIKSDIYEVTVVASINKGWHIYSMNTPARGPMPTQIAFEKNTGYAIIGTMKEEGLIERKYDAMYGTEVFVIYDKATYVQQLKRIGKSPLIIKGNAAYMGCDATICMPPQLDAFILNLK